MDPNANLEEQLRLAMGIIKSVDSGDFDEDLVFDAERLAELVEALDGWIRGGGFLPRCWKKEVADAG